MKKSEYLFFTAIEDCAELEKALSICARHGTDQISFNSNRKNGKIAIDRFLSLQATMAMLTGSGILDLPPDDAIGIATEKKMERVESDMNLYLHKDDTLKTSKKVVHFARHTDN